MSAGPTPVPPSGSSPGAGASDARRSRTATGPTAAALRRARAERPAERPDERPDELDAIGWSDRKRWLWLVGLLVPVLVPAAFGLVAWTGWSVFWWFGPFFVFVVIPLIDVSLGLDTQNPPDAAIAWLEQDRYYRWVTYLYLPLQYGGLVLACRLWTTEPVPMSWVGKLGLAVTVGCVSGIGINTAHELGHKTRGRRALAEPGRPRADRSTGTSTSSTTAATTSGSRPPRTRPARGSASRSGRSCRAP